MKTLRVPVLILMSLLHYAPLARVASVLPPQALNTMIILLRWTAQAAAALGGIHAVAGASTAITSSATQRATNGIPFTLRLTTAPDPAKSWTATPLPPGLSLIGSGSSSTWFLSGTPTTPGLYNITITARENANSTGDRVTSKVIALTVVPNGTPPSITTPPQSTTVPAGGTLALSVTAAGTGPLAYQWIYNGGPIQGQTGATLGLANLTSASSGDYAVVVTNLSGSITSSVATINVLGPAAVILPPKSQTVALGGSVSFTVRVGGTGPIRYQWQHDGADLAGETGATLSIAKVSSRLAGEYRVVVSNDLGSQTSVSALLSIDYGSTTRATPLISMDAAWRYNQTQNLDGVNWKSPGFSDTGWSSGNGLLAVGSGALPETRNTVLTLGRLTYYFRGRFNFDGDPAHTTLSLSTILDDGAIIHLNGVEIHRIGIDANASGYAALANRTVNTAVLEGPFTLPSTGLIRGENVIAVEVHQTSNNSSDICLGLSLIASEAIPNTAPRILSGPQDQTVQEGAEVTLQVDATGTAPLAYRWFLNGNEIPGATGATLLVSKASPANEGHYSVLVSNPFSEATADADLTLIRAQQEILIHPALEGTQAVFRFQGIPGRTYVVETSPSIGPDAVWTSWTTLASTASGPLAWMVDPAAGTARFFRVRTE